MHGRHVTRDRAIVVDFTESLDYSDPAAGLLTLPHCAGDCARVGVESIAYSGCRACNDSPGRSHATCTGESVTHRASRSMPLTQCDMCSQTYTYSCQKEGFDPSEWLPVVAEPVYSSVWGHVEVRTFWKHFDAGTCAQPGAQAVLLCLAPGSEQAESPPKHPRTFSMLGAFGDFVVKCLQTACRERWNLIKLQRQRSEKQRPWVKTSVLRSWLICSGSLRRRTQGIWM